VGRANWYDPHTFTGTEIAMFRAFGYRLLICGWVLAVVAAAPRVSAQAGAAQTRTLPTELADSTFWRMINTFSEPEQSFNTFMVSNEPQYPILIKSVLGFVPPAPNTGAYIGVAPEQNYHYIANLKPQIAFILDIRRQAVIQHMMFKAVFELSPTRADFISLLFGRPKPAVVSDTLGAYATWDAFWRIPTDQARYEPTLARILDHLTKTHKFGLTAQDSSLMQYTFGSFFRAGPNLVSSGSAGAETATGTFGNITSSVDLDRVERSFLANNANYQVARSMHLKNLIIPIVGDFAGTHALRTIGQYLKDHGTPVTAFYVSNVETYLGREGKMPAFGANVATLPTHANSVLLRGIQPMGAQSYCNIQKWVASQFSYCY
jgi:hypothetical protein